MKKKLIVSVLSIVLILSMILAFAACDTEEATITGIEATGFVTVKLDGTYDYSTLQLKTVYSDGTKKDLAIGQDLEITYNADTAKFTVKVGEATFDFTSELVDVALVSIAVTGKVVKHADGSLTYDKLAITGTYADESTKKIPVANLTFTKNAEGAAKAYNVVIGDVNFDFDATLEEARSAAAQDSLVIGYANFSNKFSPFFYTTAYDGDVAGLTQVGLLATDRGGAIVEKGLGEGTDIVYNGTTYNYKGMSDIEVTQNEDGTVYYDITLREGVKFSDGVDLTLNDVLFTIYVLSDTDYDGSSTFYSLPILGMNEYRTGLNTTVYNKYKALAEEIVKDFKAGEATENHTYTQDQYDSLVAAVNEKGWTELAKDIVSYCASKYSSYLSSYGNNEVAAGMGLWGFGNFDDAGLFNGTWTLVGDDVPTIADYAAALKAAYKDDFAKAAGVEAANGSYDDYIDAVAQLWISEAGKSEMGDETIDNIAGIQVTGANTFRVVTTEFSATTIYQLGVSIAPLHYYGDTEKFDVNENKFGFDKGDLSIVRDKTTQPLGAGPYKFVSYEQGIVTFVANEHYWEGTPKIQNVMFKEYSADADKAPALIAGDIDIATPSINNAVLKTIKDANSNGQLKGNVISTTLIDNNGYGYIGISSNRVFVGTKADKASDESKALRKAFATLFSVYREAAVNAYYGDRASVINYPISNCSWAAPQPNDEGYAIAYSTDVNGNAIYTADTSDEVKAEKALEAAIGFLKKAGYTWDETTKKFTAAPEGAKMSYEAWIPGDGIGDHPAMAILTGTKSALETIGIELVIKDLTNSSDLWDGLDAETVDIWAAAWGGSTDPDMYQVYHSSNVTGSNHYHIADDGLDELIMAARKSADTSYRKATYKECLEIILDWAVEIPTYQRKECTIFSSERIDLDTLTPDMTPFWSYLAEIHKLERK